MKPAISIILPCRNEQDALAFCLAQIKKAIKENNLSAEIIVSDSSTDQSPEIARSDPTIILVKHDKEGYGTAYLEALKFARGKYVFMADADGTYEFSEIPRFIKFLENGYNFVIGNRFAGKMEKGAMPLSRKVSNFLISKTLKLIFKTEINDSQCGMRAIKKEALQILNPASAGMEFASELVIKSKKFGLKTKELPIDYRKRKGKSKLNLFSDALRHLKLILILFNSVQSTGLNNYLNSCLNDTKKRVF